MKNIKELSDNELKELTFEALKECFSRGGEIALNAVTLAEKVKAEFDDDEISKATQKAKQELQLEKQKKEAEELKQKQASQWKKMKEQAETLIALLGYEDLYLQVWSKDDAGLIDKRVYLKTVDFYKGREIACYYADGNSTVLPKTLKEWNNPDIKVVYSPNELKDLLAEIANSWKSVKIETSKAIKYHE